MDLTSVFLGRVFNKDNNSNLGRKLPKVTSNDDTPFSLDDHSPQGYQALVDYYNNREEDEKKSSNWHRRFDDEYEERKSKSTLKNYVSPSQDQIYNQMALYDDGEVSRKLERIFNEENTLSVENEIAIIKSYTPGEDYLDRYSNKITIVSISDNNAVVQINNHLGKYKNSNQKINRVDFLYRMKFQPGLMMKEYE